MALEKIAWKNNNLLFWQHQMRCKYFTERKPKQITQLLPPAQGGTGEQALVHLSCLTLLKNTVWMPIHGLWITWGNRCNGKTPVESKKNNLEVTVHGKENQVFSFLMRRPLVWLQVGFLRCPQLFQLKSCEFPSNWQASNFPVGSWRILHQLWSSLAFCWTFTNRVRWVQSVCFCWCKWVRTHIWNKIMHR